MTGTRPDTGGRSRRPALFATLFTLFGLVLLIGLGTWQLERLRWKTALIERIEGRLTAEPAPLPATIDDPDAWDFRRVEVRGSWRHEAEMPLSARTLEGRIGYHIVTPLDRADGGGTVLVNRGWIPAERLDPGTRPESRPQGEVTVAGIARDPPPPGWMQPDNDPAANTWYWIDLDAMASRAGGPVAPVIVEAAAGAPGELPVGGQTRLHIPNNHLQYVLTWYGLAAVLLVIYVTHQWRRPDRRR